MSRHHRLLGLFPRSWRSRYGHEIAALLDEIESENGNLPLKDRLDLAHAGLSVRVGRRARVLGRRSVIAGCGALALVLGIAVATFGYGVFASDPGLASQPVQVAKPVPSGSIKRTSSTQASTPKVLAELAATAQAKLAEETAAAARARAEAQAAAAAVEQAARLTQGVSVSQAGSNAGVQSAPRGARARGRPNELNNRAS